MAGTGAAVREIIRPKYNGLVMIDFQEARSR